MNGLNAIGRIVPGWIAQKVGVFQTVVPSTLLSGILIFVMLAAHNTAGVVLFGIFFGFFSGVCKPSIVTFFSLLSQPWIRYLHARSYASYALRQCCGDRVGPLHPSITWLWIDCSRSQYSNGNLLHFYWHRILCRNSNSRRTFVQSVHMVATRYLCRSESLYIAIDRSLIISRP